MLHTAIMPMAEQAAPAREKRLVLRMLELWREAHRAERLPQAKALGVADTGSDADHVFTIDAAHKAGACFTYVGDALRPSTWAAPAQALVAHCPNDLILEPASRAWREIVDRGVPVTRGGIGRHSGSLVLYRSILLPLADEEERISIIMGAANWRQVEEQHGAFIE